jgi:hypothetical protein
MNKYKVLFVGGFMIYFTGAILLKVYIDDVSLFDINVLTGSAFFAAAYLLVKLLGDRNANVIAQTHK